MALLWRVSKCARGMKLSALSAALRWYIYFQVQDDNRRLHHTETWNKWLVEWESDSSRYRGCGCWNGSYIERLISPPVAFGIFASGSTSPNKFSPNNHTGRPLLPMANFYELQLILLTSFCIFSLLLERQASKSKRSLTPKERDPDRAENGHGHTRSSSSSSYGGLATLTRKYLVVYAIVMGELHFTVWYTVVTWTDLTRCRCRLASGTIYLLIVPRTICIPWEDSRHSLCHWIYIGWLDSTLSWGLGRPAVRHIILLLVRYLPRQW